MTHITYRLTANNRDQLRNPTLGNRVWANFTFYISPVCRLDNCSSVVATAVERGLTPKQSLLRQIGRHRNRQKISNTADYTLRITSRDMAQYLRLARAAGDKSPNYTPYSA